MAHDGVVGKSVVRTGTATRETSDDVGGTHGPGGEATSVARTDAGGASRRASPPMKKCCLLKRFAPSLGPRTPCQSVRVLLCER